MVGWRILLWAVLVLTALLFLYLVRGILPPFIIAFVIAALLEPSIRKLRLRGFSRKTAVLTVFLLFFISVTTLGVLIGPRVATQIVDLQSAVTTVTQNLEKASQNENFFMRWNPVTQAQREQKTGTIDHTIAPFRNTLARFGLPTTEAGIVQTYVDPYRKDITPLISKGVGSFLGILMSLPEYLLQLILIPILVFMMLMDMEELKRRGPKYIPPALRVSTMRLFEDIGEVFTKYLRGVATVTLLYMTGATIIFVLMGVPYAILVAIGFSALYLIPYIGNIIAYVVLFLLIGLSGSTGYFWHFSSPWGYAVLVTGMFVAMAMTFDHVIYPQIVGSSVGLNGIISLFVILCGGALFGLPGMILAYPLAGSLKVILDRLLKVTSTSVEELNLSPTPLRHRVAPSG